MTDLAALGRLLDTFAYAAVGVAVTLQTGGIPAPGETLLLLAAAYAATGRLHLPLVVAVAMGGAILGNTLGYGTGRRWGRALRRRAGRWARLDAALAAGEAFFARHGDKAVVVARFAAPLRVSAAFLAGVHRMRFATFTRYNILGGALWATTYGLLGYTLGANWPRLERVAGNLGLGGLALGGALLAGLAWRWAKRGAS
ncbi:MAG TPA: DedA family protein [Thermomicrobiales bacterium]|nr:DedA family protein [Thermomicrobiales bacterium]